MYFVRKKRTRKISLVPMIDVLLCLLIFFMITSKFIYFNQVDISPPEGKDAAESLEDNNNPPIYLTLIDKNNIKYLDQEYTPPKLLQVLETNILSSKALLKRQKIPVIVTIDEKAVLQDFVSIIEMLHAENLLNIQLRKSSV